MSTMEASRPQLPPTGRDAPVLASTLEQEAKLVALVVEDDRLTRATLRTLLESEGYGVLTAADGAAALEHMGAGSIDVVLLDRGLPGQDGLAVCRELRALCGDGLAVIMLTAFLDLAHRLQGFDAGVDDYVTKPYGGDELLARIKAVLRRRAPGRARQSSPVRIDERLQIDYAEQQVVVDGHRIGLGQTEFALLRLLVEHAGQVVPFATILTQVWGPAYIDAPHYVHLYVTYLRRKIERDPHAPRYILSARRVGYRFESGCSPRATPTSLIDAEAPSLE